MKKLTLTLLLASIINLCGRPGQPPQVLTNQFTTNVVGNPIVGDVKFGADVEVGEGTYLDPDGSGSFSSNMIYWGAAGGLAVKAKSTEPEDQALGLKIVDGSYEGESAFWRFTGSFMRMKTSLNSDEQTIFSTIENGGTNYLGLNQSLYFNGSFVQPNRVLISGSTGGRLMTSSSVSNSELVQVVAIVKSGAGSPEGVLTAPVGTMYLRNNGGAGTTFYVKESGSGNTGWVAK